MTRQRPAAGQPEDGQPPVRPLAWMSAVRDHPDRPPPRQCRVLDCLALRLDWGEGEDRKQVPGHGFASVAQLARDAGCDEHTVRRATRWASQHSLLDRLTRGHHLGNGTVTNSEWLLRRPPQPDTADGLSDDSQPDTAAGLSDPQPDTAAGLSDPQPDTAAGLSDPQPDNSGTSTGQQRHLNRTPHQDYPRPNHPRPDHPSVRAPARGPTNIIRAVYPDATDDEIETMIETRIANGARSAEAVIAHEVRESTLRLPCDRDGPGKHTGACRDGDPRGCGMTWCECRCHTEPVIKL